MMMTLITFTLLLIHVRHTWIFPLNVDPFSYGNLIPIQHHSTLGLVPVAVIPLSSSKVTLKKIMIAGTVDDVPKMISPYSSLTRIILSGCQNFELNWNTKVSQISLMRIRIPMTLSLIHLNGNSNRISDDICGPF